MAPQPKTSSGPLIYSKISEIMSKIGVIGKDKKNAQQGYKFRGIDDMYNALNKHLSESKVFFTSDILNVIREERSSKAGGMLMYSILTIKWKIYTDDGSFVETTTMGEAMDSGDKSMNKAMSTAYKYAFMQIFCIPTEEEKDTEHVTHEVVASCAPKKTPVKTDTLPKATAENIDNFFLAVIDGSIKVNSEADAIRKFNTKYVTTREDEEIIVERFGKLAF